MRLHRPLSQRLNTLHQLGLEAYQNPLDSGRRSCTLYSSPNLPSDVTLDYNLALSSGFQLLQPLNNPQAGGGAPITVLNMVAQIHLAIVGSLTQDANGKLYC